MAVDRRTCIFCLTEKDETAFNDEHVFPKAIGGTLVIRTVCTACNSRLGTSVDAALTDHILIQSRREMYHLAGNSGTVPDPLAQGTLDKAPHLRVREFATGGPEQIRVIPAVRRDRISGDSEHVTLLTDARDEAGLIAMTNKILRRKRLPTRSPQELRPFIKHESVPNPEVVVPISFDLVKYKLALIKIAYELTATWLGDGYLLDPVAAEIRRLLLAVDAPKLDAAPSCAGRIGLQDPEVAREQGADPDKHLASLLPVDRAIAIIVYVFDVFEAVIVMSEDRSLYPGFVGHVLVVDPIARTHEERSL